MYKLKIKIINGSLNILTGIIVLVSLFPLYWLISTSMKSKAEAFAMPPKWLFMPDFTNYRGLLENVSFLESLKNSLVISVSATILAVTLGVMAGYALARNNSRSGNAMGIGIILARMIPPMGIIIPFYMIFNYLSLTDRYVSVILIYLTTVLPFVTWIMMGFFQGVPAEIEEAALIDGCGRIGTFLRICLPVVKPGIATCAMFAFMMSWNEYFYAVIMTFYKDCAYLYSVVRKQFGDKLGIVMRGIRTGRPSDPDFYHLLPEKSGTGIDGRGGERLDYEEKRS